MTSIDCTVMWQHLEKSIWKRFMRSFYVSFQKKETTLKLETAQEGNGDLMTSGQT